MNKRINVLPSSVFNLIAAGEVVERPSSVVKELVENSIDAGATSISVEIVNGGTTSICVSDNGSGIDKDQIPTAFMVHATSKLSCAEDLFNIATLGFRGEALATIASVSRVKMTSKTEDGDSAYSISIENGKTSKVESAGRQTGTTITVNDLFYNTPARIKFLKSLKCEQNYITEKLTALALANPKISFSYVADGKKIFSTDGVSLESALYSIYGRDNVTNLTEFSRQSGNYRIEGFFSKPTFFKPNRTYQSIIVNGRTVECQTISTAVERAYAPYLMKRSYPMYVLNFNLPTEFVDVNVHPQKAQVRYTDSSSVFGFVYSSVSTMLAHFCEYAGGSVSSVQKQNDVAPSDCIPEIGANDYSLGGKRIVDIAALATASLETAEGKKLQNESFVAADHTKTDGERYAQKETSENTDYEHSSASIDALRNIGLGLSATKSASHISGYSSLLDSARELSLEKRGGASNTEIHANSETVTADNATGAFEEHSANERAEEVASSLETDDLCGFSIVGQAFSTYILAQKGNDLYIIDQHAAHERLLYDKLMNSVSLDVKQPLLLPYEIKTNASETAFLQSVLPVLSDFGFEIEAVDEGMFEIRAVPSVLSGINLNTFVNSIFASMGDERNFESVKHDILVDKLSSMACKAAIKGGDRLSIEQIHGVLASFLHQNNGALPTQCPHGRPAVIKLSRTDIEKMFKRIV